MNTQPENYEYQTYTPFFLVDEKDCDRAITAWRLNEATAEKTRIERKAEKLGCTVELVKYITALESKIEFLTRKLDIISKSVNTEFTNI